MEHVRSALARRALDHAAEAALRRDPERRHLGNRSDTPLAQELGRVRGVHGTCEMISLRLPAAGGEKELRLIEILDPLRDEIDAEVAGEPDRGAHHGGTAPLARDAENKLLSNLEPVDRICAKTVGNLRNNRSAAADGQRCVKHSESFGLEIRQIVPVPGQDFLNFS